METPSVKKVMGNLLHHFEGDVYHHGKAADCIFIILLMLLYPMLDFTSVIQSENDMQRHKNDVIN